MATDQQKEMFMFIYLGPHWYIDEKQVSPRSLRTSRIGEIDDLAGDMFKGVLRITKMANGISMFGIQFIKKDGTSTFVLTESCEDVITVLNRFIQKGHKTASGYLNLSVHSSLDDASLKLFSEFFCDGYLEAEKKLRKLRQ